MSDEFREGMATATRVVIFSVVGAVLLIGLIWGLIAGGIFASNKIDAANQHNQYLHYQRQGVVNVASANAQASGAQDNFGTQEGYIQQVNRDVSSVVDDIASLQSDVAPGPAFYQDEADAAANDACSTAVLLTGSVPESPSMKSWIAVNCSAGSMSATSPIRSGKDS